MRVTVIQTDTHWAEPERNRTDARRLMVSAPRSELYLLPEMWSTGFIMEPQSIAADECCEGDGNRSLNWMRSMAAELEGAVCGSLVIRNGDGEKFRNRFFFVRPDGSYCFYDKRHLFAYGGEDKHYEPGEKRVVAEYMGLRFLLATCYDLRFPVWLRNNNDYDVMLITANWPASRAEAWKTLLRARAIENQCLVAAANRTGNDTACAYQGDSAVIDAKGRTTAGTHTAAQQTITADLDTKALRDFRLKFPVLNDRDNYTLTR